MICPRRLLGKAQKHTAKQLYRETLNLIPRVQRGVLDNPCMNEKIDGIQLVSYFWELNVFEYSIKLISFVWGPNIFILGSERAQ